ncbi:unnamed protein product, partial [Schistosoma margrebowiei]
GGKISLVCEPQQSPKIVVTTSGSDSVYELEPDHGTVYFSLVNVRKSVGKCLQNIQYRYRTKATDDSFAKARENLVKEVENSRQQKIKALDYQLKSASLIKDERNTKARNPSSKKKSVQRHGNLSNTSPELITNSLVNIKAKVSDKSDKQKVTHTSGTADVNDVEKVIYNKCLSAVQRRNVLEQRLREAYTNTDEFVRAEEIEKIKMDLCTLVDDLYTDELLKKWIPMSIGSA